MGGASGFIGEGAELAELVRAVETGASEEVLLSASVFRALREREIKLGVAPLLGDF